MITIEEGEEKGVEGGVTKAGTSYVPRGYL